ncbi:hypothetical protein WKK05_09415 [Nostoc sp. UHCC 0302]
MINEIDAKGFQLKRLGRYLVDAEVITPDEVNTVLKAQKLSGKLLGEILVMHGLVKQQTIEYFMANIVIPELHFLAPKKQYRSF